MIFEALPNKDEFSQKIAINDGVIILVLEKKYTISHFEGF